jgi:eukaryotic-like serine/threonine-protein kinase
LNTNPSPADGNQPSREETLFHAARLLSRREDRAAFLALACADEPELRQCVEGLLAARAQADAFFDAGPGMSESAPPAIQAIPDEPAAAPAIGRYKLLQKIGEGGCGVVYMAEQEEPVRRLVALKIIKLGMDTDRSSPASKPSARPWP